MPLPLTKREEEILSYILGYISDNNYSPTREEISLFFNITSQGADYFIQNLVKKNRLYLVKNISRNIRLIINT